MDLIKFAKENLGKEVELKKPYRDSPSWVKGMIVGYTQFGAPYQDIGGVLVSFPENSSWCGWKALHISNHVLVHSPLNSSFWNVDMNYFRNFRIVVGGRFIFPKEEEEEV